MSNILISNLNFQFSEISLFKDASLTIHIGCIHKLIGANGIGKTTLLKILSRKIKCCFRISQSADFEFIQNEFDPFDELTGHELIKLFMFLNDLKSNINIDGYLEHFKSFGIESLLRKKYFTMSRGEKQKMNIVVSFLNPQNIVLLDEPFTALDGLSKRSLCLILNDFQQIGYTILYVSHSNEPVNNNYVLTIANKGISSVGVPSM